MNALHLETIECIVGTVGSLSYYAISYGLIDQIRKIHVVGELPESLSLRKLTGNGFRYTIWTLWACAQSPLNGFFLATRLPGAVLSTILLSQKFTPRRSLLGYCMIASIATFLLGVLCSIAYGFSSEKLALLLEIIASASLLWVALIGAKDQIVRLRVFGTTGVSKVMQLAFAINYTSWSLYSWLDVKHFAAASFALAAIGSWLCVAQFSRLFNSNA